MSTTGIPTPATLRRRVEKLTARGVGRPIEAYARGLGRRGTISLPEVLYFRAFVEAYMARPLFRADADTHHRTVRLDHQVGRLKGQVRGEWVERGTRTRTDTVVLYVHGGAFIAFSPRTHRGLTSEIAARSGRSVFSVDYRLAPEHRFPTAADDTLRAYSWLLSTGVAPERIVVAGDSAGGHLALGLVPRAVRAGLPVPAAVVGLSPVVDAFMQWSRECELRLRPGREPVVADAGIAALGAYTKRAERTDPEMLLTEDDLSAMPPVLLQASEHEMLLDDSKNYLDALREAGGEGELQTWVHKPHVFQVGFRHSRSASDALDRVADFITTHAGPA